jgi:hypothetical protein
MHDSQTIASVAWRDKKTVRLLSTHARPVVVEGEERPTVPRRNGAIREAIPTSPVHLEYTTHMRGVDVADQLRSNYSCQVRTHKWWHRIFYFLLDMSVVNMYLMYLECWKKFPIGTRPMAHLQFRNNLCKAMTQGFHGRDGLGVLDLPHEPRIHIPSWTKYRRECTLCGKRCHYFCFKCNCKFMCFSQGCFERRHTPRR